MKQPLSTFPTTPLSIVLVSIRYNHQSAEEYKEEIEELKALAATSHLDVVKVITQQRTKPHSTTFIGSGKLNELLTYQQTASIKGLLIGDNLTAVQMREIEKVWKHKLWDRSLLILEIFAKQARSKQAKAQVALAQNQYLLPRLTRMWSHLSRQRGGGVMMRGVGEKELETDRRILQKKINILQQNLANITKQSEVQSKQRAQSVRVSLVGYTNAGKSTLMKAFTHVTQSGENKLFATLTTTIRKVTLKKTPFLLSDTVGFIRALPKELLQAFRSTLSEVCHSNLLLHLVDISHSNYQQHISVVHNTLSTIEAHQIPRLTLLNKWDLLVERIGKKSAYTQLKSLQTAYPNEKFIPTNATDRKSLQTLRLMLYKRIKASYLAIYPNKIVT